MECSDRSNPHREVRLNIQKSVWTIVPKKLVKAKGGKGPAVEGECETKCVLR